MGIERRIAVLEEAERQAAAVELRERLGTVSDEEIARWMFEFRRSRTCGRVSETLDEALVTRAGGVDWPAVGQEERDRRLHFICRDVLGRRRDDINRHIKRLEGEDSE